MHLFAKNNTIESKYPKHVPNYWKNFDIKKELFGDNKIILVFFKTIIKNEIACLGHKKVTMLTF